MGGVVWRNKNKLKLIVDLLFFMYYNYFRRVRKSFFILPTSIKNEFLFISAYLLCGVIRYDICDGVIILH